MRMGSFMTKDLARQFNVVRKSIGASMLLASTLEAHASDKPTRQLWNAIACDLEQTDKRIQYYWRLLFDEPLAATEGEQ